MEETQFENLDMENIMQPSPIEYQHNIQEEDPQNNREEQEGGEEEEEEQQQQMSSSPHSPPTEETDENCLLALLKLTTPKSAEATPHNDVSNGRPL